MGVIFLFIDGIGIGKPNSDNPLFKPEWKSLSLLTGGQGLSSEAEPVRSSGLFFSSLDATLGVAGLPQSGTGQASLFSGKNAPAIAGRHFGPFPHSKTRFLLEEQSLFHILQKEGYRPHFINAYPEIFFKKMHRKKRWTCTTLMASSAGQSLNGLRELKEGKSVTAGITQRAWREQLKLEVDLISEEVAAERVVRAIEVYDLVMYEYYLTDKAGHSMSRDMSMEVLKPLDKFIGHILAEKNSEDHLVISSDHGNLEDLSTRSHTVNPVPLMIEGPWRELKEPRSIMDVPEIILDLLKYHY